MLKYITASLILILSSLLFVSTTVSAETCTHLCVGKSGEMVKILQQNLNQTRGNKIKEDGIYGADTKAAVMSFQRDNGLVPDGKFGPASAAAMFSGKSISAEREVAVKESYETNAPKVARTMSSYPDEDSKPIKASYQNYTQQPAIPEEFSGDAGKTGVVEAPKTFSDYVQDITEGIKEGFDVTKEAINDTFDKVFEGNPNPTTPSTLEPSPAIETASLDTNSMVDDLNSTLDNPTTSLNEGAINMSGPLENNATLRSAVANNQTQIDLLEEGKGNMTPTQREEALKQAYAEREDLRGPIDELNKKSGDKEESGTDAESKSCAALAVADGKPIKEGTENKYNGVKYTPQGFGKGYLFELKGDPSKVTTQKKITTGKDFISVKGDIMNGSEKVCCARVELDSKKQKICKGVLGKGSEYGGIFGGQVSK